MVPCSALPSMLNSVPAPERIFTLLPVQRMYCADATTGLGGVEVEPLLLFGGVVGVVGAEDSGAEDSGEEESEGESRAESVEESLLSESPDCEMEGGVSAVLSQAYKAVEKLSIPNDNSKAKNFFLFFINMSSFLM